MARRIHVAQVHVGEIRLAKDQAHHVRDVLRLADGAEIEVFDEEGNLARGIVTLSGAHGVTLGVDRLETPPRSVLEWSIAAAVPKGERADWMVEKLSELGCDAFIPLATERSVVLPEGKGKRDRWSRLATESAKQSRRRGVMRIEQLTPLERALDTLVGATLASPSVTGAEGDACVAPTKCGERAGWYLSTEPNATPIDKIVQKSIAASLTLFIGPEGGWSPRELELFRKHGLTALRLTETILRVETAAVAAGAIVAAVLVPRLSLAKTSSGETR